MARCQSDCNCICQRVCPPDLHDTVQCRQRSYEHSTGLPRSHARPATADDWKICISQN